MIGFGGGSSDSSSSSGSSSSVTKNTKCLCVAGGGDEGEEEVLPCECVCRPDPKHRVGQAATLQCEYFIRIFFSSSYFQQSVLCGINCNG